MGPPLPWTLLWMIAKAGVSGHHALRLFHDGEAHAAAMPVRLRDFPPGVFGLFASLERTLDLGGSLDQLVEIHRTEFAADHPEIAAVLHFILLLFSCLIVDFRTVRLELRGFCRVVERRGRAQAAGDGGRHQIEVAGADFALMARCRIAVLFG